MRPARAPSPHAKRRRRWPAYAFGVAYLGLLGGVLVWLSTPEFKPNRRVLLVFEPPLEAGKYIAEVRLDDGHRCTLSWDSTHMTEFAGSQQRGSCDAVESIRSRSRATVTALVLSGNPRSIDISVRRNGEHVIDEALEPVYTAPCESCPPEGLAVARCIAGASTCAPFTAACDGPEDCGVGEVCCASASKGYRHGRSSSTTCMGRRLCAADVESFSACHSDRDCEPHARCDLAAPDTAFRPPLAACRASKGEF